MFQKFWAKCLRAGTSMVEHESGGERTFIVLGGEATERGGKMIKSPIGR